MDSFYWKEKTIFEKMSQTPIFSSKHIIKPIQYLDDRLAIVLEPFGRQLSKENLTSRRVEQMFDCVQEIHQNGIIHRDLSPAHFYISGTGDDERVFVIDVGSCFILEKEKQSQCNQSDFEGRDVINYVGSTQFAANEIVDQIVNYK